MAISLDQIMNMLRSSGGGNQFNPDYGMQAESAYQLLASQLANLGQQEAETGTEYERQLAEAKYGQQDATRSLLSAMANRGTLQSGITTRAMANQGRQYTSLLDQLANARQSKLSDLAGQRIGAEGQYNMTMGQLSSAFAGQSAQNIANQLAAAAQRQQNEAQMSFQNQLTSQQNAMNQQMMNAYQTQQKDFDALRNSLIGTVPPTSTTPTAGTSGAVSPTQPKPNVYTGTAPTNRILKPIGSPNMAV